MASRPGSLSDRASVGASKRSPQVCLARWLSGLACASLAACGGAADSSAPDGDAVSAVVDVSDVADVAVAQARLALFEQVALAQMEVRAQAEPAYLEPNSGMAWDWTLSLPPGAAARMLHLAPQRGRGYAEPLIRLVPRDAHGKGLREAPRPDCRSETRCEFSGPGKFVLTLPPGTPLRAEARGDAVALVANVLAVGAPVEVTIRLLSEGRTDQSRLVVLLP